MNLKTAIRWWAALAVTLAMVAAGITVVLAWRADGAKSAAAAAAPVQTTTVIRTDLSTSQSLSGTLGYGSPVQVNGSQSGIVTWLPAAGATVTRGQPLYRVDNQPVPLFYGSTPLYRTLNVVGMVGPDVQMIAGNLTALGYDIGYQPPVGSLVTQEAQVTAGQGPASVAAFLEPAAAAKSPSPTASPSRTASPAPSDSGRALAGRRGHAGDREAQRRRRPGRARRRAGLLVAGAAGRFSHRRADIGVADHQGRHG